MKVTLTVLLAISLAGPLLANDDCTVAPPKPLLQPSAVRPGSHTFAMEPALAHVAPGAVEKAVLKSGVKVTIRSGGCAHWGEEYSFERPDHLAYTCADWLKMAIAQLTELEPAMSHRSAGFPLERLQARRVTPPPYRCGEEILAMPEVPDYGTIRVSTSALAGGTVALVINTSLNP